LGDGIRRKEDRIQNTVDRRVRNRRQKRIEEKKKHRTVDPP
jgi:hypothetical protein